MKSSLLLLTQGDVCGVGPEVVVRAAVRGATTNCVVVGDPDVLLRAAALIGSDLPIISLQHLDDAGRSATPGLNVWAPPGLPCGLASLPWGCIDARAGAAAVICIEAA